MVAAAVDYTNGHCDFMRLYYLILAAYRSTMIFERNLKIRAVISEWSHMAEQCRYEFKIGCSIEEKEFKSWLSQQI